MARDVHDHRSFDIFLAEITSVGSDVTDDDGNVYTPYGWKEKQLKPHSLGYEDHPLGRTGTSTAVTGNPAFVVAEDCGCFNVGDLVWLRARGWCNEYHGLIYDIIAPACTECPPGVAPPPGPGPSPIPGPVPGPGPGPGGCGECPNGWYATIQVVGGGPHCGPIFWTWIAPQNCPPPDGGPRQRYGGPLGGPYIYPPGPICAQDPVCCDGYTDQNPGLVGPGGLPICRPIGPPESPTPPWPPGGINPIPPPIHPAPPPWPIVRPDPPGPILPPVLTICHRWCIAQCTANNGQVDWNCVQQCIQKNCNFGVRDPDPAGGFHGTMIDPAQIAQGGATDGQVLAWSNANGTWEATTASSAPFTDTTAIVKGSADSTKQVRFEVDSLTTGTTRVITVPDKDINLANLVSSSTPAALTADQNDYAPTLARILRLQTDGFGNRVITGLAGGVDGMVITVVNVGGLDTITLNTEDAASAAANRFNNGASPANVTLAAAGGSTQIYYDGTDSRWRHTPI